MERLIIKWDDAHLEEAVNRYNVAVQSLANVHKDVMEILNGVRKTQNKVDKRTLEKVNNILDIKIPKHSWLRVYLNHFYEYTLYVEIKYYSPTNNGCEYNEVSIPVAELDTESQTWKALSDVKPQQPMSYDQVKNNINSAKLVEKVMNDAINNFKEAQSKIYPFIK